MDDASAREGIKFVLRDNLAKDRREIWLGNRFVAWCSAEWLRRMRDPADHLNNDNWLKDRWSYRSALGTYPVPEYETDE